MNDDEEDGIDVVLREQFKGPVPDDGFCDRVIERLPARRRRNRWPLAVGTLAGMATCGFSLWSAPIMHIGWRDWLSGELSASALTLFIAMTSMAILALAWTVVEVDDRYDPSSRGTIR